MFQKKEVGEAMMVGDDAAAADHLDLEAAEQLIQLSGGDDGASECRSSDSVNDKCCGADQAGGMKDKDVEVAVESRRRRKRSAGRSFVAGKQESAAVEESRRGSASAAARFLAGRMDGAAGVVHDREERRKPRFRWLADIYRETRPPATRPERRAAGGAPGPHPEADDDRRKKRKRAADADEGVVVPMVVPKEIKAKERTINGGVGSVRT